MIINTIFEVEFKTMTKPSKQSKQNKQDFMTVIEVTYISKNCILHYISKLASFEMSNNYYYVK